jgi:hypothetical protein
MSNKKAVGMFSATIRENGGEELILPAKQFVLRVKEYELTVGGFARDDFPVGWGVQLSIDNGEIKPGSYPFNNGRRVGGIYNPRDPDSSWIGQEEAGNITLLEVDLEKKFVRGTYKFIAVSSHDPQKSAEIEGSFSLTE